MKAKIIKLDLENRDIQIQFIGSERVMQFESYVLAPPDLIVKENDIVKISRTFTQPNEITIEKIYSAVEVQQITTAQAPKEPMLIAGSLIALFIALLIFLSNFKIFGGSSTSTETILMLCLVIAAVAVLVLVGSLISLLITLIIKIFNAFKK